VPVEEKFRVPLDTEKEAVGRRFNRLYDTIGARALAIIDGATALTD